MAIGIHTIYQNSKYPGLKMNEHGVIEIFDNMPIISVENNETKILKTTNLYFLGNKIIT